MKLERVSLLALFYFVARSLFQLVKHVTNLIPLVVLIFAGGEQLRNLVLIAVPVSLFLHGLASWWFFRYGIEHQTLHLRDGILKRTQLTLDYDRIQQADVRQPWYFRPFGLAVLGVESAGSDGREVELAGLPVERALELKQDMLAQRVEESIQATEQEAQAPDLQISLPLSEVARYGLIHNPIILIVPVIFAFSAQLGVLDELLERLDGLIEMLSSNGDSSQTVLLWTASLLLLLAVVVGGSVLIAIVRFYGFNLAVTGERYQTRFGMFTIVSRGFQYVRLQRVVWRQGLVARLLGRKGLRIDQSGRPDSLQLGKAFFVPVLDRQRELRMRESLGLDEPVWQSVHPMSMAMPWFFITAIGVGLVTFISEWDLLWISHAVWIFGLFAAALVWPSWRKRAVFVNDNWVALRRGFFGQKQCWIPAYKMQTLRVQQGPWLRLCGVAALHVYSAAGRETVSWLPSKDIQGLYEQLLAKTNAHQGRWM